MSRPVVVLSGGIGGAKLALGLNRILPPGKLTVVVNTGDDFDHLGLRICPDIDTTLYTLSGLANRKLGWGRGDESWSCMAVLEQLGGESWFRLGDKDLALHLMRTQVLANGSSLSDFTTTIARQLGIDARVLPATNDPVATVVETEEGTLAFQEYFVRRQCRPRVTALHYRGAEQAVPAPGVLEALHNLDVAAVVIAPSNPYLSIAPILAIPGMREALKQCPAPVIAVTPVINGEAVKGPTTKIMSELELRPSAETIAEYYCDLIDGFVLDSRDTAIVNKIPVTVHVTDTLMVSLEDRERLAQDVLAFASSLRSQQQRASP